MNGKSFGSLYRSASFNGKGSGIDGSEAYSLAHSWKYLITFKQIPPTAMNQAHCSWSISLLLEKLDLRRGCLFRSWWSLRGSLWCFIGRRLISLGGRGWFCVRRCGGCVFGFGFRRRCLLWFGRFSSLSRPSTLGGFGLFRGLWCLSWLRLCGRRGFGWFSSFRRCRSYS